jgi:hypothetical protein
MNDRVSPAHERKNELNCMIFLKLALTDQGKKKSQLNGTFKSLRISSLISF